MDYSIVLAAIIIGGLVLYTIRWFTFWTRQGIRGPGVMDLISAFSKPLHVSADDWNRRFGKVYGVIGLQRVIVINDPELIHQVIVKYPEEYSGRFIWYIDSSPLITKMMFWLPYGEEWKRLRALLSNSFTTIKVMKMTEKLENIADKLVIDLKKFQDTGKPCDLLSLIQSFVMDGIGTSIFDIAPSVNAEDNQALFHSKNSISLSDKLMRVITIFAANIANKLKFSFAAPVTFEYFTKLVEETASKIRSRKDKMTSSCLMDEMVNSMDEDNDLGTKKNKKIKSKDELVAQVIMLYMAGYDTTTGSLLHTIYYLAKYPTIQEKVFQEVKDMTDFSFDKLNELGYLNAVISESLRMSPPILYVPRYTVKDMVLSGIKIPAYTTIYYVGYVINRDPDYWSEPDEFKPERFLNEEYNPRAYLPFGAGPRICLGQKFALAQSLICCAKLVKNFRLSLEPDYQIDYVNGNNVLLPNSLMVKLEGRQ